MAAYKGEYLLKNPFQGTQMLKRANQGFQGAQESLAAGRQMYQGALADKGTRTSYMERYMPTHTTDVESAERALGSTGYAKAQHEVRLQAALDRKVFLKKWRSEKSSRRRVPKQVKKYKRLQGLETSKIAAQRGLIDRYGAEQAGLSNTLANKASQYNTFFGGRDFASPNILSAGEMATRAATDANDNSSGILGAYGYQKGEATDDAYQRGLNYALENRYRWS